MNSAEQEIVGEPTIVEGQEVVSTLESGGFVESPELSPKTIKQIKRALLDPHAISKKYESLGRSVTALEVLRNRKKSKSLKGNISDREGTLTEIERQAFVLRSSRAEKLVELEKRTEEVWVRLKSKLGFGDETAATIGGTVDLLRTELDSLYVQSAEVRTELEQFTTESEDIPDPKDLLEAYYEKMETVPLLNEEKRELLKPEVLAELSMEEYIALWRRLNPHFLSHVTRQGFRDHNAMMYHSAGLQEFHNGLVDVLEDGKTLRPPMSVRDGLRARDEVSVKKFLEKWALKAGSESEAKERLYAQLNFTMASAPNYPDKTAVHFAAQIVADGYYGGETNNEVFFLYPSDVLASQHEYAFNGWQKDFTKPQSEEKWNDVFVWPGALDNPGISVDSGIVFLPESTPVDPETGSKYASEIKIVDGEEKRVMVEDEVLVSLFIDWAKNLTISSPVVLAYKAAYGNERDYRNEEEAKRALFDVLRQEMLRLGFDPETAAQVMNSILSNDGIGAFIYKGALDWGNSTPEEAARGKLQSASANWKRAKNPVPSKQYWEKYFEKNPKQKPKHLVFYSGDPTSAIYEFQQRNNIGRADITDTEGKLLGFDDHHVVDMNKDPRANAGYDELVKMADSIIEEHYRS
ncbi:MAG: hypothetical protein WAW92_03780 [Minisyncoccia bacterium]